MKNLETLNKKYKALNKKYISLDNTWNEVVTEDAEILLSQKLESIQQEMCKISNEIESIEETI